MTEDATNLVLEMLKRLRASVERMELDIQDVKTRVTGIEVNGAQLATLVAAQSGRLDRIDERVARIERRLDLVEHH